MAFADAATVLFEQRSIYWTHMDYKHNALRQVYRKEKFEKGVKMNIYFQQFV